MLGFHCQFHVPRLEARIGDHYFLHPEFRIFVVRREGVIEDDGLFRRGGSFAIRTNRRSVLIAPLQGEVSVRAMGRERLLPAGSYFVLERTHMESVRMDDRSLVLSLEWGAFLQDGPAPLLPAQGRLDRASLDWLRAHVLAMSQGMHHGTVLDRKVWDILVRLRAEGISLRSVELEELHSGPSTALWSKLSRYVGSALSVMGDQPMLVDLESGVGRSNRQVYQDLVDFLRLYNFNSRGWRELLRRTRLQAGLTLMSAKDARTEEVSRILGYSSPTAFCRAFASAGLPSPGSIRSYI